MIDHFELLRSATSLKHTCKKAMVFGTATTVGGLGYGTATNELIPSVVGVSGLAITAMGFICLDNAITFENDVMNDFAEEHSQPIDS